MAPTGVAPEGVTTTMNVRFVPSDAGEVLGDSPEVLDGQSPEQAIESRLDHPHEVRPIAAAPTSPRSTSAPAPRRGARRSIASRLGGLRVPAPRRRGASAVAVSGLLLAGLLGTATAAALMAPRSERVLPPSAFRGDRLTRAEAAARAWRDAEIARAVIDAAAARLDAEQAAWERARAEAALIATAGRTGVDWDGIAECETGGNWRMQGPRFSGGVGFYNGTWNAFGGRQFAPNAGMATREQQIVVAERVHDEFGLSGWGCKAYG